MENIFVEFLPPWVETGLQPAFYDKESGTVLQQTARMYARVNMLIRMFNKLSKNTKNEIERFETAVNEDMTQYKHDINEIVDNYIEQFNQLHDYVHDYFDNLDVQEEINNKLDEMAEQGILQEIITAYIQSNVAWTFDTVADMKLATNLVNGSYAKTLGYYAVNDGGGALYKITNTSSSSDFQETIGDLYANLIFNDEMSTKQFGITESMTDATSLLQSALNLCIANKSKLKIQTNVNLTTLQEHIITIDGNIKIDGCNNTIYNNVTGDYHSLFYISGITEIKNLTITDGANEPTENTGNNPYYRVDFYLQGCSNSIIENVTINDCIGVWQFICNNCENVKINNNTINYNENYTLSYDRTSIYLNGFNLQCENNILNGKSKARTGIESHGDNILISNNEIKNYRNPIYIVNDHSSNKIHNVNVLNNYSYTERGICVWLTQSNISVDTINILDNTVITTGDWYALYTYDVIADNFTVENINIKNNVIRHLNSTTTKEAIRIYPTHVGDNNNVVIKNIDISDNYIKEGGTSYTVNLADQISGVIIENIYLTNNTFYCNQYNYLAHYVSTNGYINNVYFNNNIIKNNGASLFNISTSTKNGVIQIHYNDVEKDLTNVAAGNLNINTSLKGIYPVDLKTWDIRNVNYINIQDLNGNTAKTVGAVNNYILYNDTVLTGSQFKKGDIIWNTNPVIGQPIGWISISNANFRIIQNILGGT